MHPLDVCSGGRPRTRPALVAYVGELRGRLLRERRNGKSIGHRFSRRRPEPHRTESCSGMYEALHGLWRPRIGQGPHAFFYLTERYARKALCTLPRSRPPRGIERNGQFGRGQRHAFPCQQRIPDQMVERRPELGRNDCDRLGGHQ